MVVILIIVLNFDNFCMLIYTCLSSRALTSPLSISLPPGKAMCYNNVHEMMRMSLPSCLTAGEKDRKKCSSFCCSYFALPVPFLMLLLHSSKADDALVSNYYDKYNSLFHLYQLFSLEKVN